MHFLRIGNKVCRDPIGLIESGRHAQAASPGKQPDEKRTFRNPTEKKIQSQKRKIYYQETKPRVVVFS